MTPTAAILALQLSGGLAQALGLRSMPQFIEPSGDPDSAERLVQELVEEYEPRVNQ